MKILLMKFARPLQIAALFLAYGLLLPNGFSQSTPADKSSPPLPHLGDLTGDFTFVKKIVYKAKPPSDPDAPKPPPGAPPTPPDLQELDAAETGTVRRDQQTFVDGTSTETWRSGPLRLFVNSSSPNYVLMVKPTPGIYEDMPDFKELDWVKPNLYQGEDNLNGTQYYLYKHGDASLWVDETTLLPVYFESNGMQVTYTYNGPPDPPLQLSGKFLKKLQEINRGWSGKPS